MKRIVIFLSALTALVLSKATIDDTATLFKNTLKKWNVEVRDERDYMERYNRLVRMKRSVDDTTTGVILDTLNRFSVNNDQEHETFTEMWKRSGNLTAMATMMDKEKEEKERTSRVEISKRGTDKVPESYDFWEKIGFNEPRDQFSCGSCWLFPNIATMEVVYKYRTGEHVSFSPEYMLGCRFPYSGCAGGGTNDGYKIMKDRQYLMYEEDWPYSGVYEGCKFTEDIAAKRNNALKKMWFSDWEELVKSDKFFVEGLLTSPVAFGSYITKKYGAYSGGVFEDQCKGADILGHAQLLIGYTPEYLRVRGSHGSSWGEKGYINYKRFSNNLLYCKFFDDGYIIKMDRKREMQYKFCSKAKLVKRSACKKSCEAMNKVGQTGWSLAIIPTEMHNNELVKMANDRWPDVSPEDNYNYLFIGLLGRKRSENGYIKWEDEHTLVNYANNSKRYSNFDGVYGLINKNMGYWTTRGNFKFEARGFCSRPRTCWDFSSHIPNAEVMYSHEDATNLVEGTTAQVKCKEPCKVRGDSFSKCEAGLWSGSMEPKVSCSCPGDNDWKQMSREKREKMDENKNIEYEKEADEEEQKVENKHKEEKEGKRKETKNEHQHKNNKKKEEKQEEKKDKNCHKKEEEEHKAKGDDKK